MNRISHILLLTGCVMMLAPLSSCRRDNTPESTSVMLLGKWTKTQYATDDNANGVLDSWEIHDVSGDITNTLEFRKDATGVELTTAAPDLNFNWRIGGDISLIMEYGNADTISYHVDDISGSRLTLSTGTKFGLAGYYYVKSF